MARFLSLGEAGAAKSALEAAGIECWLGDDTLIGLDWQMAQAIGLIKLRVRGEDLELAREVLASSAGSAVAADVVPSAAEAAALHRIACPECGSPDFERTRRARIFAIAAASFFGLGVVADQLFLALTAIAGITLALLVMPSHRCKACDHRWTPEIDEEEVEAPAPDESDTRELICRRCGSIDVYDIDYRRLKAWPLLFAPAVLPVAVMWLVLPKKKCNACGLRQ